MTGRLRTAATALGLATVYASPLITRLAESRTRLLLYHWDGTATALFGPAILATLTMWALLTLLLFSAAAPEYPLGGTG